MQLSCRRHYCTCPHRVLSLMFGVVVNEVGLCVKGHLSKEVWEGCRASTFAEEQQQRNHCKNKFHLTFKPPKYGVRVTGILQNRSHGACVQ